MFRPLLLAAVLPLCALAAPQRFQADVSGHLQIEPDGRVAEVVLSERVEPALAAVFIAAMKQWRFEPVPVEGVPARVLANMELGLSIEMDGREFVKASIDRVDFIDPPPTAEEAASLLSVARMDPPRYPEGVALAGIGGRLDLLVETDADGRVQRAGLASAMLFARARGANERVAQQYLRQMEDVSIRAAKRWVLPQCRQTRCTAPVQFFPPGMEPTLVWRPVVPVAVEAQSWMLDTGNTLALTASGEPLCERFKPLHALEGPVSTHHL